MQLLLINPNTSQATTERLRAHLQPLLPGGVQLRCATARFGAPYIACEASYAVAGHALLDAWAHAHAQQPADRVLIGCFGDPGLWALREAARVPVTGLAEASFMQAARHGRFAIVTGGERWALMLERLASALGMADALQHIETVTATGAQLQADPALAQRVLTEACRKAAASGARAIIVGGAGLAGYAAALQPQVDLPLIDSTSAGLQELLQLLQPVDRGHAGFFTTWTALPAAMTRLGPA